MRTQILKQRITHYLPAIVILATGAWRAESVSADPETTGHWEYRWMKRGVNSSQGVYNNYDSFPHYANQQPLNHKVDWPLSYNELVPLDIGLGDNNVLFTDETGSFSMSGSYGIKLSWVSGTSNDPPPSQVCILDYLHAENWTEASDHEPASKYVHDYVGQTSNGIGSPVYTYEGQGTFADPVGQYSRGCQLLLINNYKHKPTIFLKTYHLSTKGDFKLVPGESVGGDNYAETGRSIAFGQIKIELRARSLTGDYLPTEQLIAGGKETSEHNADVRVTISDLFNHPIKLLKGMKVNFKATIADGKGVQCDAKFSPAANPEIDATGQVVIGTVTTSDKIQNVHIKLDIGLASSNPTATISQVWDDGDEWSFMPFYGTSTNSTRIPVTFQPHHTHYYANQNMLVRGHNIKFKVTRVLVSGGSSPIGPIPRIYTLNPNDPYIAGQSYVISDPEEFASFYGVAEEEELAGILEPVKTGTYKAYVQIKRQIPEDETIKVEKIWFKAQDQDVYTFHP